MLKFARQLFNTTPAYSATVSAPVQEQHELRSAGEPARALEPDFVIGEHTSILGKIAFQGHAVIHGVFEGEVEGGRSLYVGPQGFVKADIEMEEVEVFGKVEGNITAKIRLVLRGNAEIRGHISAPRLSVDEGVSILGQVYVTPPDSPDLHTPF